MFVLIYILFSSYQLRVKPSYQSKAAELKIWGGTEGEEGRWPFMVRFFYNFGQLYEDGFCDDTLIAPRWILTAAHCMTGALFNTKNSEDISVFIGSSYLWPSKGSIYKIEKQGIVIHPLLYYVYKTNIFENDIALVKLTKKVESKIKPIQINSTFLLEKEGQKAVIIGWGSFNEETQPVILRQGILPILANLRAITNKYPYNTSVKPFNLVAGYPRGGINTCSGDSGGPLIVWNGTNWVQAGVTSWGDKDGGPSHGYNYCGGSNQPGIYTRLSYKGSDFRGNHVDYLEWIKSVIGDDMPKYDNEYFIGTPLSAKESEKFNRRVCDPAEWDGKIPSS